MGEETGGTRVSNDDKRFAVIDGERVEENHAVETWAGDEVIVIREGEWFGVEGVTKKKADVGAKEDIHVEVEAPVTVRTKDVFTKKKGTLVKKKKFNLTGLKRDDLLLMKMKEVTGSLGTGTSKGKGWKKCSHVMQPFVLTEGHTVYLSGHSSGVSKEDNLPNVGVYLDRGWIDKRAVPFLSNTNWSPSAADSIDVIYVNWPDHGTIPDVNLKLLVSHIMALVTVGKRVEIACWGGHGRTGTLAAALLASANPDLTAKEVIERVKDGYCKEVIETIGQENMIARFLGEEEQAPLPFKTEPSKATPSTEPQGKWWDGIDF